MGFHMALDKITRNVQIQSIISGISCYPSNILFTFLKTLEKRLWWIYFHEENSINMRSVYLRFLMRLSFLTLFMISASASIDRKNTVLTFASLRKMPSLWSLFFSSSIVYSHKRKLEKYLHIVFRHTKCWRYKHTGILQNQTKTGILKEWIRFN